MSIDHLYPFAGDHAIQNAILVFEWGSDQFGTGLNAEQMKQVAEAARTKLHSEFPRTEEMKLVSLQLNPDSTPQSQQSELGGIKLVKQGPFGTSEARSVIVARDHCAIQFSDYTRWGQVKADFDRYMTTLLPTVCAITPIKAIAMQVTDVFTWKSNPADLILSEVFAQGSRWLPPHVFELKGLWHAHHGFFVEDSDARDFAQLDNVNISRASTEIGDVLQILMSHRATLNSPCWDKTYDPSTHIGSMILEKLHGDNKSILKEVLTEQVLTKISLQ